MLTAKLKSTKKANSISLNSLLLDRFFFIVVRQIFFSLYIDGRPAGLIFYNTHGQPKSVTRTSCKT